MRDFFDLPFLHCHKSVHHKRGITSICLAWCCCCPRHRCCRYTAVVPAEWAPNTTQSQLTLGFFDGAEQFFPAVDGGGVYHLDWPTLGLAVTYGPAQCSAAAHTVPDPATGAACVCDPTDGIVPESGGNISVCI